MWMAPLCGMPLGPADRRVWQQAIALLIGLKMRNGLGEKELTAAVGTALHHSAKRNCEDCRVKVARGATILSGRGVLRGLRGLLGLAIPKLAWPSIYIESPARYVMGYHE